MELKKITAIGLLFSCLSSAAIALAGSTSGAAVEYTRATAPRLENDGTKLAAITRKHEIAVGKSDAVTRGHVALPAPRHYGYTSKEQKFNLFLFEGNQGKSLLVFHHHPNTARSVNFIPVVAKRAQYAMAITGLSLHMSESPHERLYAGQV